MPSIKEYNNNYGDYPTFIMMIGLPASGKSTFINNISSLIGQNTTVISSDFYIERFANIEGITYSEAFKEQIDDATDRVKIDFSGAIQKCHNIIWDQTNLTPKSRAWKIQALPSHYRKIAINMQVTDEVWDQRLVSRKDKVIPSNILQGMLSSYCEPILEEGFDEILFRKGQ